ncbi:tryptophan 7-halogenase [Paraglaciecola sp.]|uniref:tryptophan 7-halogenase n=1 Tax=Paraglaciecola sp. TaxID=1920173 RepID=UPI003EF99E75
MTQMLKSIVVVGNSLSAWLSAATINRATRPFGTQVSICTLAEVPDNLGNMSLRPEFDDFIKLIGISEAEFMQTCSANFKLANCFQDWNTHNKDYYHGFGECGTTVKNIQFSQFYARLCEQNKISFADSFNLGAQLAKHNKFVHPDDDPMSILSTLSYGWNINAEAFYLTVKQYCSEQGIHIHEQALSKVETDSKNSVITSLQLEHEKILNADLFIDCSVDHSLMHSLQNEWHSWSSQLPDCEVKSVDCKLVSKEQTYNLIKATTFGWQQEIPSQQKLTRHYYSAKNASLQVPKTKEKITSQSTKSLSFGIFTKPWLGNCISIGYGCLSLPPMCFSELDLAWIGLKELIQKLPAKHISEALVKEYNELMSARYNNAKEASVMHFYMAEQDGSTFWQQVNKVMVSKSLDYKLITYQNRGKMPSYANEVLPIPEQYSLLMGMTDKPKQLDLMARQVPIEQILNIQDKIVHRIQQACSAASSHKDYIQTYCYRRDKSGV